MKKIFEKPFGFTAVTILCLAVFLTFSCSKSELESKIPDVSFTPCRQDILRSNSLSDKVDVEFTGKGVQITHCSFAVTCDFTTINVTHTLINGVLTITQQGSPNQAKCICYTDVSYTIDGILQNEVNVIFINGIQVYCYNENNILQGTKWKLIEVSITKDYQQPEITDYSEKNIIYDFQDNNKLFVTGFVLNDLFLFDDFHEGEHFYEYSVPNTCPTCLPGPNLQIYNPNTGDQKGRYYCNLMNNAMTIVGDKRIGGIIDETGLITGSDFYKWKKTFIKLK